MGPGPTQRPLTGLQSATLSAEVDTIAFVVRPSGAVLAVSRAANEVVPFVGGRDFIQLIGEYEAECGFDVPGSYGGIIHAHVDYGPLDEYYLGRSRHGYRASIGKIAVLGCSCGDVECWPLYAEVRATDRVVIWSAFQQPYRPERDYGAFGPFEFDRKSYDRALRDLVDREDLA
jgi:hypothetical protein